MMKRKTIAIIGVVYLLLIAVILVVGLNPGKVHTASGNVFPENEGENHPETDPEKDATRVSQGDQENILLEQAALNAFEGVDGVSYPNDTDPQAGNSSLDDLNFDTPTVRTRTETSLLQSEPLNSTQTALSGNPSREVTTSTPQPTTPSSFTPTPTPQPGWTGDWIAYLEQPGGGFVVGKLVVSLSGEHVSAQFDQNGTIMNLDGSIYLVDDYVSGMYITSTNQGYFKWLKRSEGAFTGSINNELAFCAAREGLPQPQPCGYFDPK
ncbi:MAG: hypothetical protein ACOX7C_00865 [Brevefilum sp.]|jgi:hypothetical protein